jgi:hypothetical protein
MDFSDRIRSYKAKALYSDFAQRQTNPGANCSFHFSKINYQNYELREAIKQGSADCQSCGTCSSCRNACYISPGLPNPFGSLFNGTNGYLLYPNYNFAMGTQPFTVEWYQNLQSGLYPRVFSLGGFNNTVNLAVSEESQSSSNRDIYLWISDTGAHTAGSNKFFLKTLGVQNVWTHMALVGNGAGAISFYANGILQATCNTNYNIRDSITSNPAFMAIGSDFPQSLGTSFNGHITSFRYVIGTALYNGNFTPSTQPPANISGTELLLNFDTSAANPYADASGEINRTPIASNTSVIAFSPYN